MGRMGFSQGKGIIKALESARHALCDGRYHEARKEIPRQFNNRHLENGETIVTAAVKRLNQHSLLLSWWQNETDKSLYKSSTAENYEEQQAESIGDCMRVIRKTMDATDNWNRANQAGEEPLALLERNPFAETIKKQLFGDKKISAPYLRP